MPSLPNDRDHPGGSTNRKQTAPLGIKLYCLLSAFGALYVLFLSVQLIGASEPFTMIGFLFFAITIGFLAVLYGLWTLQPWGWKWAMTIFALSAIYQVITFDMIAIIVHILLLVYLQSKETYYR